MPPYNDVSHTMRDINQTRRTAYNRSNKLTAEQRTALETQLSHAAGNHKINSERVDDIVHVMFPKLDQQMSPYISHQMKIEKRKLEIEQFYILKWKRQKEVFQKIVFYCAILMFITVVYKINLMSDKVYSIMLGIVLAVAFITIFYDLWDIFLRNNNVFNEYDFAYYSKGIQTDGDDKNSSNYASTSQLAAQSADNGTGC